MKFLVKISLLLLLGVGACRNAKAPAPDEPAVENYENRFFTLDFASDSPGLSDFENHFFTTFPHDDPTLGKVVYDRSKWTHDEMIEVQAQGLLAYTRFRADSTGFDSFRFTTKAFFNLNEETRSILFVFKGRLPSENGMWPAWWLNGSREDAWTYQDSLPAVSDELLDRYSGQGHFYDTQSAVNCTDWPGAGEIDIIENINGEGLVYNTLHTCPQMCDSEWNDDGVIVNCANAKTNDVNPGCSGKSYLVEELAGTFACIWEQDAIRFYYWPPGSVVKENGGPLSADPNPDSWTGEALKNKVKLLETEATCDEALHQSWQCQHCAQSNSCRLQNMKMIFNVTLCGAWAGNAFDRTPNAFSNCEAYISGEGKSKIDNQSMQIEYVSVKPL